MPFHSVKLNDGRSIPAIGFGSWKIPRDVATHQTDQAIEVGFDHIDTAQVYYNEEEVGRAIKESGLSRKELWVTTKWSGVDGKGPTQSCNESLEKLGLDYIDLYLIHSPRLVQGDYKGKWEEMEKLVKEGKVKSIGVSNFQIDDLRTLLKHAKIPPVVNQILLHPYVIKSTEPLLAYMHKHHIVPEAYSALIPITQHPDGPVTKPVTEIAERLGKKPEQVLLAWVKAKHAIIVTTSSRKERLQGYLEVGDIELTHDDVKAIDKAGGKGYLTSTIAKRAVFAAKAVGVSTLHQYDDLDMAPVRSKAATAKTHHPGSTSKEASIGSTPNGTAKTLGWSQADKSALFNHIRRHGETNWNVAVEGKTGKQVSYTFTLSGVGHRTMEEDTLAHDPADMSSLGLMRTSFSSSSKHCAIPLVLLSVTSFLPVG